MQCIFKTNPAKNLQDDYLWYCLSGNSWRKGPRSGYAPDIPEAGRISSEFSSICFGSSYLVFKREYEVLSLAVGVPTGRVEVGQHHRPITDTLYLVAENDVDETTLCGFAALCLATDDAQGLCSHESEICTAIDNIWKLAFLDEFVARFGGHLTPSGNAAPAHESWHYPRNDMASRRKVANWLPSMVKSNRAFLVALTDRSPNEALQAIPAFAGVCHVFSSRVVSAEKVACSDFSLTPSAVIEWAGKHRKLVAGIAIVVILILLTLLKSCSNTAQKSGDEVLAPSSSLTSLPMKG